MFRKAELAGNCEGVTFSGNADQEAVGGTKGLHAELAAAVFHTGSREGEDLQLAVMGRGHRAGAAAVKLVQDGDGEGCSLCRVRTCTQLIEEHEGTVGCLF